MKPFFFLIILIMFTVVLGQIPSFAQGTPAGSTKKVTPFKDVEASDPNLVFINYISQKGIINGFPDGTYHPREGLTRAQAAVVICKAAGLSIPQVKASRFTDVSTNYWAIDYINTAEKAGYLSGFPDGSYRPETSLTRAQGISLVMRLCTQRDKAPLPVLNDLAADNWAAGDLGTALALDMIGLSKDSKSIYPDAEMSRGNLARALAVLITKDPGLSKVKLQGKLSEITGRVTLVRNGQSSLLKNECTITEGDQIETDTNSSVRIGYPDGSSNLLEANSVIKIVQSDGRYYIKKDGSQGIAVDYLNMALDKGTLYGTLAKHRTSGQADQSVETDIISNSQAYSQIAALDSFTYLAAASPKPPWYKTAEGKKVRVKVDMPWGVAAIRGTYVKITVNPDRTCRVSCLGGNAQLTGFTGNTVTLTGNDTASVKQAGDTANKEGIMNAEDKAAFSEVKVQVFFIDNSIEQDVNQEAVTAPSLDPEQTYQDAASATEAIVDALNNSGIKLESEAINELQEKIDEQLNQLDVKTATQLQEQVEKIENQPPPSHSGSSGSGSAAPIALSISDPTVALTKIYDGTTTAAVSAGTLSGANPGDSLTVNASANYNTADVGTGKTITVVYTITGTNAGSYVKPDDFILHNGVITVKQLAAPIPTLCDSKQYDGTTTAAVTLGALPGVIAGDDVSISAVANYESPALGSGKTINTIFALGGSDAGNYIKPIDQSINTGEITAKQLTISDPSVTITKVYDGTTTAAVTPGTLSGVVGTEEVIVSAIANYNSATAGSGKNITVVYTITGANLANYVVPASFNTTGVITPKQLTISDPTLPLSKVYDGTTTAAVTPGTLAGVVGADVVTVSAAADFNDANADLFRWIIVVYTLAGADAGNYLAPITYYSEFAPIEPAPTIITNIAGITAPVTGQAPDTDIDATLQYTGSVTWSPADNPYQASKTYTATITITLYSSNYTIIGLASNYFTVAGAISTTCDTLGTVTAVFPATAP